MPDEDENTLEPEELAALQYTQRVMKGALVNAAQDAVNSYEPGGERTRAMMRAVAIELALAFVSGYREGALSTIEPRHRCKLTANCALHIGHPGPCVL
jgi:hypothetical protein